MERIFIGDVQGCADELDLLLEQVERARGGAVEPWWVGDLVNRGPASLRVLRRVRERVDAGRGRTVLGNHDLALIQVHLGLRRRRARDTFGDVLDARDAGEWIDWLRRRPVVEIGRLAGEPFAMVHAAVPPDWSLERIAEGAERIARRLGADDPAEARRLLAADPERDADRALLACLTTCRSVDAKGGWSNAPPSAPGDAWHRRWSSHEHDYAVVYGHWSMQRLHVEPGLRGLDTGCVHDGRGAAGALTAWLAEAPRPSNGSASVFAIPDERFHHVFALARYYDVAPEDDTRRSA